MSFIIPLFLAIAGAALMALLIVGLPAIPWQVLLVGVGLIWFTSRRLLVTIDEDGSEERSTVVNLRTLDHNQEASEQASLEANQSQLVGARESHDPTLQYRGIRYELHPTNTTVGQGETGSIVHCKYRGRDFDIAYLQGKSPIRQSFPSAQPPQMKGQAEAKEV